MAQHKKLPLLMIAGLFLAGGPLAGCSQWTYHVKRGRPHEQGLDRSAQSYIKRKGGSLPKYDMPIEVNDRVLGQIDHFMQDRERFKRYLSRSSRYEKWMKQILKEEGVPQDLFYLALIESGFSTHAYSRARALGPWQFIRSTGRIFDLDSNWWLDERKDPEKSTRAAARYLKRLYREFGDWYLALAAYNAGEGKIRRAVREAGISDFWAISRPGSSYLKAETRNYVPRYIAAALIAKMPYRFGMQHVAYDEPFAFEEVVIKGPMDLGIAAGLVGAQPEDMIYLNPELNQFMTPPHAYRLRLPVGKKEAFKNGYAQLPSSMRQVKVTTHRVRKGESLGKIAKRYGVSAKRLLTANHLNPKRKLRAGTMLTIPRGPEISRKMLLAYNKPVRKGRVNGVEWLIRQEQKEVQGSEVTATDVTENIEEAEEMEKAAVSAKNVLDAENVKLGEAPEVEEVDLGGAAETRSDVVVLPPRGKVRKGSKTDATADAGRGGAKKHIIRPGDNLWRLSRRYGVSLRELREWNNLASDRLRPGKALIVGGGE